MRKSPFPHWLSRKNSLRALAAALVLPAAVSQAQTAQDLGVPERSAFAFPADGRDPFLPVGWEKPRETASTENPAASAQPALRPEMFVVTSTSVDRIRLAVINGKAYGEGDILPVEAAGQRALRVQVLKIQDGMVTLTSGSLQIACPLRLQQALPAKKP